MPQSNHLPFPRPLYDIALRQFILTIGSKERLKFTFKMHKIVANFLCKLLETQPFSHFKENMVEEEVKTKNRLLDARRKSDKKVNGVVPRSMVKEGCLLPEQ